jgi:hypothetical protein
MLCLNSNIGLRSIFSILSRTVILTLKQPKCPTSTKLASECILIAFCLKISFHKLQLTNYKSQIWGNDKYFLPLKFHKMWPIAIRLVDAPTKLPWLIQWFVFTFMPQSFYKLKQLNSTCIAFNNRQSKFYDQSLQWHPMMWHSYMNFSITWIILWTKKFDVL